jgi:hypothetical protein
MVAGGLLGQLQTEEGTIPSRAATSIKTLWSTRKERRGDPWKSLKKVLILREGPTPLLEQEPQTEEVITMYLIHSL